MYGGLVCLSVCTSASISIGRFLFLLVCTHIHVSICMAIICFTIHPYTPLSHQVILLTWMNLPQVVLNSDFVTLDIFTLYVCSDMPNDMYSHVKPQGWYPTWGYCLVLLSRAITAFSHRKIL